jgi:hypothetical protein
VRDYYKSKSSSKSYSLTLCSERSGDRIDINTDIQQILSDLRMQPVYLDDNKALKVSAADKRLMKLLPRKGSKTIWDFNKGSKVANESFVDPSPSAASRS